MNKLNIVILKIYIFVFLLKLACNNGTPNLRNKKRDEDAARRPGVKRGMQRTMLSL
jgi:hypothetical protein